MKALLETRCDIKIFSFFNRDASNAGLRFPKALIAAINTQSQNIVAEVLSTNKLESAYQLPESVIIKLQNVYGEHLAQPLHYLLLKNLYTDDEILEPEQTTQCGLIAYLTEHYEAYQLYMQKNGYAETNFVKDYQFALSLMRQNFSDNAPYPRASQAVDAFLLGVSPEKRDELISHATNHFIPKL